MVLTPTNTAAGSAKESRPSSFNPMCRRSLVKDGASANSRSICATEAGGGWFCCGQEGRYRGMIQERTKLAGNPRSAHSERHPEKREVFARERERHTPLSVCKLCGAEFSRD